MKTYLLILGVFLLISNSLFGQIKIDAGTDTIICVGMWGVDITEIGGHPTAWGGIEPYVYSWETNYTVGSSTFGASYFLDDSTKANPKIVNSAPENLKLILTVSDNNGTELTDSINVRFSSFAYISAEYFANIDQGDTATLGHTIGSGIEPLSFAWSPNYNISDTSINNPQAWPEVDTDYKVIATDSVGCISEPYIFKVNVSPVAIVQNKKTDFKSLVFPNPIDIKSVIFLNNNNQVDDVVIKVFNGKGQLVLSDNMESDTYQIGNKINQPGLYIYLVLIRDIIISSGQFVKK